jgi:hypothetical protein
MHWTFERTKLLVPRPFLVLTLGLYAPMNALAAEAVKPQEVETIGEKQPVENKAKKKRKKGTADSAAQLNRDRSENIRENQTANIDVLYTPLSDFVLSYGAGGSYNISSNLSLGVQYLTGQKTIHESSTDETSTINKDAKLVGSAAYLSGRYFFGNSFNLLMGLGLRAATIDYSAEEPSTQLAIKGKVDIKSVVLPIFIGNRWTFKSGFTVGCDWIGAFIPLTGTAKASVEGNLPQSYIDDINDDYLDMGKKLAQKTSYTLFLTSLGWSF